MHKTNFSCTPIGWLTIVAHVYLAYFCWKAAARRAAGRLLQLIELLSNESIVMIVAVFSHSQGR